MRVSTHPRPIVVGVDGSPGARAALRFAFEEGRDRGLPVTVVTTWMPEFPMPIAASGCARTDGTAAAHHLQDGEIATVLEQLTDPPEHARLVVNDVSGPVLIEAARNASLLVVGTGQKGPLSRAFLGSVSEFCVRHSPVPVVVVPDPAHLDQAGAAAPHWLSSTSVV